TRARCGSRGGHRPCVPASQQARSSSRPSDPGGLASVASPVRVAAAASSSGASTRLDSASRSSGAVKGCPPSVGPGRYPTAPTARGRPAPAGSLPGVTWSWRYQDAQGQDVPANPEAETFSTKGDAESWLGES